ncbi:unnamed protein product [Adineta steineri]|uniref:RiboL-PSP-HEPN domain-containing protein n=1 Tax=Adineta steineri TaxID=433720 RepID=A0A815BS34_9BILA|nr:unnamed protein product [Adineta steineri]CAF3891762.1 unnamed protein product [Adineta steineri]
MTTTKIKTIWEYKCYQKQRTTKDFRGCIWPNIRRNYTYYSEVDNPTTFDAQETLHSFIDTSEEFETLQRNDYLVKVANAVVFFGEKYIIEELNNYIEAEMNERYDHVQQFRQWQDVTYYIGNRNSPGVPVWKQDKKQKVYEHIRDIAQQKGIPPSCWNILMQLYQNRNSVCHVTANIADAESMKDYANNSSDRDERESVQYLYKLVVNALGTTRRGRR